MINNENKTRVTDALLALLRVEYIAEILPDEHLVDEDTQRPPVDRFAVTFTQDDFGRQVLGRSTQRPRPAPQAQSRSACQLHGLTLLWRI